ncbi:MAG: ABC transporter ATP-binding protein [Ruminococcus sp.]|nr:ABC transporter ATP-binding protein [Ruminococcus sp.]
MSEQIICSEAALGYEDGIVTEGLNFSVSQGDYLCILGENGSGKSTLIKALLGLKPQVSGEIRFCGGFSAKDIGYLPQQTPVQRDFPASVREIVLSGCLSKTGFFPFYRSSEKKIAEDTMKQLGIDDIEKRCYRELSGGQQQRVLLARALCAASKMLLLDEPVTGLDPIAQTELYELIAKLNSRGITIIMVSHDISSAVKYASHILHISKKQLFFGTKADYIESSAGRRFLINEEGNNG